MNLPSFLAGILVGAMALWIFLELIALAAKRRAPGVTMAGRKRKIDINRMESALRGPFKEMPPGLSREEKRRVLLDADLAEVGGIERGVRYEVMGVANEE
jgi:hypothetical protein